LSFLVLPVVTNPRTFPNKDESAAIVGDTRYVRQEAPMTRITVALVTMLVLAAASVGAMAQDRKCPKGKVPHPSTGKCVVPDGSH